MDEEVEDLLLSPFSEILEKARVAIDNADDASHADMSHAAQGLVKEAERARKTIEPIARRQLGLYGANFVSALKDHDGIAEYIFALTELVYVFDDYTSVDTFDGDRYKELGKLAQQTTLRIIPILKRMKLEVPSVAVAMAVPVPSPSFASAPIAPGSIGARTDSIGGRSSVSYFDSMAARSPRPSSGELLADGSSLPRRNTMDVFRPSTAPHVDAESFQAQHGDEIPVMGSQSGPDLGYNGGRPPRAPARQSLPSSLPPPLPPMSPPAPPSPAPGMAPAEPSSNPWQLGVRLVDTIPEGEESETLGALGGKLAAWDITGREAPVVERRRRVSTRPDSPTLPDLSSSAQSPESPLALSPPPLPRAGVPCLATYSMKSDVQLLDDAVDTVDAVDIWQTQADESEPKYPPSANTSPRTVSLHLHQDYGQPEMRPMSSRQLYQPQPQSAHVPLSVFPPASQRQPRFSTLTTATTATTASTTNGSIFSISSYMDDRGRLRESGMEPLSPLAVAPGTSPASPNGGFGLGPNFASSSSFTSESRLSSSPTVAVSSAPERSLPQLSSRIEEQPGLEAIHPVVDIDSGLIPVETSSSSQAARDAFIVPRPADCNIGPSSSFHLLKGFCEGAKEVMRGGAGVRRVQKLSYSGAGNYAAKCSHCLYELQWSEVDRDRNNAPDANYRMQGIGFRLRFLSKSHLPAKQIDAPMYACLFCLQEGRTIEQSDATVFFSQGQLFKHLARHPRPLPDVPGITVVDAPERPEEVRDNYDLHFSLPPVKSELDGIRPELSQLPTGTTVETFRKMHGSLRRPADDAWPHQFPVGAKIVGIEFPAKYKGEWGVGWHDNVRAPFPAEMVRLDTPSRSEMRAQGTSSMRAVTRWRWATGSAYRNSEWLRLDKNETITNIAYASPAHWCWAGTNSRGKWGYFPQSHVEPNSLKEVAGSDKTSVSSREKISAGGSGSSIGGGFMSRFRAHNTLANGNGNGNGGSSGTPSLRRPVSVASSSTSSSK